MTSITKYLSAMVIGISLTILPQCDHERWPVKTCTDATATQIVWSIVPTTIDYLAKLLPPLSLPYDRRVPPVETTMYSVGDSGDVRLVGYRLESDHDYHLVLSDPSSKTMIAEIPDPSCIYYSSSVVRLSVVNARTTFYSRFHPTPHYKHCNVAVRVVGIGFFDFPHGQVGRAPNNIELHPVLEIDFNR